MIGFIIGLLVGGFFGVVIMCILSVAGECEIISKEDDDLAQNEDIPKAYKEIKALDPHTDLTLRALRRMVKNGEIPSVQIASKNLINLDLLLEVLSCYNNDTTRVSLGKGHKN